MPLFTTRTDAKSAATSDLLRSYQKAQFWRRLILAGFFTVFIATVFYVVPWLPYGLSEADYNGRVTFLLVLMLIATVLAFGAIYLRDLSNRVEQTMLTWTTVNDGLNDLRRREYLFDRIVLECSRAGLAREPFTVVALRVGGSMNSDTEKIHRAIKALEPIVRDYDCLASLGPHEIAVLAQGIGTAEAPGLEASLTGIVAEAFPGEEHGISAGHAVFGADATEAGALIGIARERLMRSRLQQPAVAANIAAA